MLNKLYELLKLNTNSLLKSSNPFSLAQNIDYHNKNYYTIQNIVSELFDPKDSKELIFSHYIDISNSQDTPNLHQNGYRFDLFVLSPKMLGREYAKTCSFIYQDNTKEISLLVEILSGEGYILLENLSEDKTLKLITAKKGDFILIPKGFAFILINRSENKNFISLILTKRDALIKSLVFAKSNGASVFYTKKGFIKNSNNKSYYDLDEYFGDYLDNIYVNKEKGLYDEVKELPDKFNFLK